MDSYSGGAQGGQGARARRRPSRIDAIGEVRGECKKARRSGPCGVGVTQRGRAAGRGCNPTRKAPWISPGRCEFVQPLFYCFSQTKDDDVTVGFTRAATAWKAPSRENYLQARFPAASRPRSGVGCKRCWAGAINAITALVRTTPHDKSFQLHELSHYKLLTHQKSELQVVPKNMRRCKSLYSHLRVLIVQIPCRLQK